MQPKGGSKGSGLSRAKPLDWGTKGRGLRCPKGASTVADPERVSFRAPPQALATVGSPIPQKYEPSLQRCVYIKTAENDRNRNNNRITPPF